MARFRASLQGARGTASRLGHPNSPTETSNNGWHLGVVTAAAVTPSNTDTIEIFMTSGSAGGHPTISLGSVELIDDEPSFIPSAYTLSLCAQLLLAQET